MRCMHCDCRKLKDCKLRNYADQFHAHHRKYTNIERKTIAKFFEHDRVVYEPEKCIRCGLCIDITIKNGEGTGFAFVGRGFDVRIEVPFGKPVTIGLTHTAAECVESCPTGALSFKDK